MDVITVELSDTYHYVDKGFMIEIIDLIRAELPRGAESEGMIKTLKPAQRQLVNADEDSPRSLTIKQSQVEIYYGEPVGKDFALPGDFDAAYKAVEKMLNPPHTPYPALEDLGGDGLHRIGFNHWRHAINAVRKELREASDCSDVTEWKGVEDSLTIRNCPADLVYKVAERRGDGPGLFYSLPCPLEYNL